MRRSGPARPGWQGCRQGRTRKKSAERVPRPAILALASRWWKRSLVLSFVACAPEPWTGRLIEARPAALAESQRDAAEILAIRRNPGRATRVRPRPSSKSPEQRSALGAPNPMRCREATRHAPCCRRAIVWKRRPPVIARRPLVSATPDWRNRPARAHCALDTSEPRSGARLRLSRRSHRHHSPFF